MDAAFDWRDANGLSACSRCDTYLEGPLSSYVDLFRFRKRCHDLKSMLLRKPEGPGPGGRRWPFSESTLEELEKEAAQLFLIGVETLIDPNRLFRELTH